MQLFAKTEIRCYMFSLGQINPRLWLAAGGDRFEVFSAKPREEKNFLFGFAVTH
jgi:hypothetical protein